MTAAERREAAVATDFLAKWSAQEEELFALGRMLYGKDLRAVATLLPNKTPAELVEYYYLRKRPAPPPPSSARRAAKEEEEVEVELPREANCTKCGHHRVVARRCTAAGCTTAVCGRCIYNPALVPKGHTESVKNAWWRCEACVTTRCEATPKGSAVHGAHGVCASCGDVKPTRLLSDHPWLHTPMCLPCLGALCCACAMVPTDGAPPAAAAAPPASPSLAAASSSSASSTATAGASDANACTVGDGDDDDPWFCQRCGGHDGRTAFKCGGDDCNHSGASAACYATAAPRRWRRCRGTPPRSDARYASPAFASRARICRCPTHSTCSRRSHRAPPPVRSALPTATPVDPHAMPSTTAGLHLITAAAGREE